MADYGRPLRLFLMNLLTMGYRLWVEYDGDGHATLRVQEPKKTAAPPVVRTEIERRARFLVDILQPFPAGPLEAYYGRLLSPQEEAEACRLAMADGYTYRSTSIAAGGKWLVEVRK
jgi:hypothetical protein